MVRDEVPGEEDQLLAGLNYLGHREGACLQGLLRTVQDYGRLRPAQGNQNILCGRSGVRCGRADEGVDHRAVQDIVQRIDGTVQDHERKRRLLILC